jgi:predicted dehydrogenase
VLLEYGDAGDATAHRRIDFPASVHVALPAASQQRVGLSVIGAGSFATHELLPLLKGLDLNRRGVVSLTGIRAQVLASKHGFAYCASSIEEVLDDSDTQAVLILTRHDTHAELATRALMAGKHVFVEKPLALDLEELDRVRAAQQSSGKLVMVGFNRRYARLAQRMKQVFAGRTQPMLVTYFANVGYRPPEHWLHDPRQGGGVILGEACHHLDFCCWLVGAPVDRVHVASLAGHVTTHPIDTIAATLTYADGSIANVCYASNGNRRFATESVQACSGGRQARLIDFRCLETPGKWMLQRESARLAVDKGHRAQLTAFLDACAGRGSTIDVQSYLESSRIAVDVSMASQSSEKQARKQREPL